VVPREETGPDQGTAAAPALELNMDDLRRRIDHETAAELVSLTLGDSDVSLQVSGYWKGTLSGNLGVSLTPLGAAAVSPDSPILFQQEADLTLSLWLRERWFVEAAFLDDYNLNTYRAGYQGRPGEMVQYVGFGNRGLDFPNFPYLDLGGDSPSSFGIYGRFGGEDLQLHGMIRYDLAALEERIFVGDRERTFVYTPLNQPIRGRFFVLPDENLSVPPRVYLEDEKGELRDENGRRWRLAASSEYAAGAAAGLVELGVSPAGMVAVAYSRGGDTAPWNSSLGSYGNPAAIPVEPGSGFLGEAQNWFGAEAVLKNYPQPGAKAAGPEKPGAVLINGVPALVVYEPGTFSPFERMSRYGAASSASASGALVRLSTGDRVSGYEILSLEDNAVSADIPLYALPETRRGTYELTADTGSRDRRSPDTRWPLASLHPRIYLPGSGRFTGDMGVRFTNYGSAGSYNIGTDVVPGSVQVWRGGMIDQSVVYDAAGGTVTLENPAGFNETIRITYLKRSEERRAGSLAGGLGAVYDPEGPFSSELALGMRWNFSGDTHAESGALNPGTVGLGAKTAWDYDFLKARITGGLGFEQPDTTGLYRAAGMEGNEITLALSPDSAFISEAPGISPSFPSMNLNLGNRSTLIYRNYRDTNILGSSNLMPIDWGGAVLVSGQNGPYPVRDPGLSSQTHVLAAEFSLDAGSAWAGFESPLGGDSALFEEAREIEIPFRFYGFNQTPPADFTLILQIGALSDKDLGHVENPGLIVEKQLYPPPADPNIINQKNPAAFDTDARLVGLRLTEEDRRKLRDAKHLRIFAVHTGPEEIRGRVLLAPPIVRGLGFRPVTVQGTAVAGASDFGGINEVRALERIEAGSGRLEETYGDILKRLHSEGQSQRVLELSWKGMDAGTSAGLDGRISAPPLANYRKLGFFVKIPAGFGAPANGALRFILARGPESLARRDEIVLDAEIPLVDSSGLVSFSPGEWSPVEITYRGGEREILVGGRTIEGARLVYRHDGDNTAGETGSGNSGYLAVLVSPGTGRLPDGGFLLDEIFLADPSPAWRLNGGGSVEWKRPGVLASYRGRALVSDLSLSTALESGVRGDPFAPEPDGSGGAVSRSSGEITLLGTLIRGNFSFSVQDGGFSWSGGHGVSRSWGPFSVEETFSSSPEGKTMDHRFGLGLSGMVSSRLNGEVFYEDEKLERKWNWALGFSPQAGGGDGGIRRYIPGVSLEAAAAFTGATSLPETWIGNYGAAWTQSWVSMAPDLGAGAVKRDTRALVKITESTSPVGAELSLEGGAVFSGPNNRTQSDSLARLDIPLVLGASRLNLRGERRFRRHLLFSGQDVLADGAKFTESLRDSLPLWKIFPFYSLFSPRLGDAMDQSLADSPSAGLEEYTAFDDRFDVNLQFPALYDFRALFVPASTALRVDRILEQKLDTRLDMLNLGAVLGFSAINMFGAFGVLPLFSFYQGDEFTHTLDASVAIPREEQLSWRFQSSLTGIFHGFSGGELGFTNTLTTGSTGWLESFVLDWTGPTKKSLLSLFYGWITAGARTQSSWLALSELLNANYEQFRKETLELAFDHGGDYPVWTLIAGHESIIRIMGRLYFSVFAKLNCSQDQEAKVLSFIGTLGTTLNVSF
jgi:hypothetical protein